MKALNRLTLAILLASSLASPAFASDQDEATLKAMEQTWATATANTDRVALEKLLDDSFVDTTPSGSHRSKSDLLLAPPPPPGSTQTLMDMEVRVNGDTAIVTGINQFRANRGARPVDYSFTDVFVRKSEGWRAIAAQMIRK
ncbi:nuclear transport factor 2 family protein [Paraburkholderia sp. BL17N1]|uniref:nuclear transport factor 2 family protein n=1 Tax=Paraburkholderia sp. BL17N1 TaxID=1938798 RepID=UPI000EAE4CF4|nr:nuclear transport factor 2 family protein [Paraburkholderia sp. BL17N1]RKR44204.1 uncharacterized protein DUF4440 [Paraburkholderia sp. BL17N1]